MNPFQHTHAVTPERFIGRAWLIESLAQQCRQGCSIMLVGPTTSGRTSILRRVEQALQQAPYAEEVLPSFLDIQTLPDDASPVDFWHATLSPLFDMWGAQLPARARELLERARAHSYRFATLTSLLKALEAERKRLVLLIDHIDMIVARPQLLCSSFLGGLRALTSDGRHPLALIPSSARTIAELHRATEAAMPGSPCFNNLIEYILGPVSREELGALLLRAGDSFHPKDHEFIWRASGGQLYFAQVLAGCLWMIRRASPQLGRSLNRHGAGVAARDLVHATLDRHWSEASVGDRWLLLTIALRAFGASEAELLIEDPDKPRVEPCRGTRQRALAELLEHCLRRSDLDRTLRGLSERDLAAHLPSPPAPWIDVCFEAADLIVRHALEEPLLDALAREFPGQHARIDEAARACGCSVRPPPTQRRLHIPDFDRMQRAGVLVRRDASLEINAGLLRWWLTHQFQKIANGTVRAEDWFSERQLEDLDPRRKRAILQAIYRAEATLRRGSEPLIARDAQ